jgi:hypothetical protein
MMTGGSSEHDFIITFSEISYGIGKGDIKTKDDVMKAIEEGTHGLANVDNMYNLIMWALQDVLEDDKNPLYDEAADLPIEYECGFDPSWN